MIERFEGKFKREYVIMKRFRPALEFILLIFFVATAGAVSTCAVESQPDDGCPDPLPSVEEVISDVKGLPLTGFIEESYYQIFCRQADYWNRFRDISDSNVTTTFNLQVAILNALKEYDSPSLSADERISYDVYYWYLDDKRRQKEFMYYDYIVNHYINSVIDDLDYYFTSYPIYDEEYGKAYIKALEHMETTFSDLMVALQKREALGISPPKFSVKLTVEYLANEIPANPQNHFYYTHLEQELARLYDMGDGAKSDLKLNAEQAIQSYVIPGYQEIRNYLQNLLDTGALTDHGVGDLPDGDDYYAWLLHDNTTTDMTTAEIHQLGIDEAERIKGEMRAIFDTMGEKYTEDKSMYDLYSQVAADSGSVSGDAICLKYEEIIDDAYLGLSQAFNAIPSTELEVICGEDGDYYIQAWGDYPGQFYAKIVGEEALYNMPTLAYHETVPGHHFQISLAQESSLPEFRKDMHHTAYLEGWALYAERLVWELGWYDDNVYGNLGRLQDEMLRAARLVVDTGIHSMGWTFDEAVQYMEEKTGFDPGVMNIEEEVGRYFVMPAQATAYKIGMLRLLELRQRAVDQLGTLYDLKEFHDVVLSTASVPLDVLEYVVDDFIAGKLKKSGSQKSDMAPNRGHSDISRSRARTYSQWKPKPFIP
jgi:uncharacterized protein (DUF885 family)